MNIRSEIIEQANDKWRNLIQLCMNESRDEHGNINAIDLERLLTVIIGEGE